MLVDVVELRVRGVRRTRDQVLAATPVRGLLQMSRHRTGYYQDKSRAPMLAMLLSEAGSERLLEPLDEARVLRISRGALLIAGLQRHVRPIRVVEDLPQGWWIKPVAPAGGRGA